MSGYIGLISPEILDKHEKLLDCCHKNITLTCNDFIGKWKSDRIDLRFGLFQAIEDTDKEELPYSIDQNLQIVGDVRLDSRDELVIELNKNFPQLKNSFPDSYILLHAYMIWGADCVNRIAGDYSFAIWNEAKSTLFCARDHFGIIPFYYAQSEDGFLFTNFYLSLKEVPGLMTELNEEVLKSYLFKGTDGSFTSTIYKNIKKLPAAHTLTYSNGSLTIRPYWTPQLPDRLIRYKTTEEYVAHFTRIFVRSVSDRSRTNRVACQLSGGMDSSSVTAMTKKALSQNYPEGYKLVAYNMTYNYLIREREGYFATLIANKLEVELKQVVIDDCFKKLSLTLDEWMPEPTGIRNADPSTILAMDAVHSSLNVLFTGFGSDVLFIYDRRSWWKMLRKGYIFQIFKDTIDFFKSHGRPPELGVKNVLSKITGKKLVKSDLLPVWLNSSYISEDSLWLFHKSLLSTHEKVHNNHLWKFIFEYSHQGYSGMRIKIRHPFFSLELINFLSAIPPHLLYNKYLLRLSMSSFLPAQTILRPKTLLYGEPIKSTLQWSGALSELITAIGEEQDFLKDKVNISSLLAILKNPEEMPVNDQRIVRNLINIIAWKRMGANSKGNN